MSKMDHGSGFLLGGWSNNPISIIKEQHHTCKWITRVVFYWGGGVVCDDYQSQSKCSMP